MKQMDKDFSQTPLEERKRILNTGNAIVRSFFIKSQIEGVRIPKLDSTWDTDELRNLVWKMDNNQFDNILVNHGERFLRCVSDYYLTIEEYEKCSEIQRQVEAHNNLFKPVKQ